MRIATSSPFLPRQRQLNLARRFNALSLPKLLREMDIVFSACRSRRQNKALSLPIFFSSAPEAQRKLAGGEATGIPVIIAFAPQQGRGTSHRDDKYPFLETWSSAPIGARRDRDPNTGGFATG